MYTEESICNAGDLGSVPVLGRSSGEGNGEPLQYFYVENPMNSVKRQNDRILKGELPRSVGPNMLLEMSGEITPERMKG